MARWSPLLVFPKCYLRIPNKKIRHKMYAGKYSISQPNQACVVMASNGAVVTYDEFEGRSNQLAHLLADHGLKPLDHYAIFMENNACYLETCAAGERAGLYYTCINSYLSADEMAFILNDSESKVLITSVDRIEVAREAIKQCRDVLLYLVVGGGDVDEPFIDYEAAILKYPTTPIRHERLGTAMLYSSGTTGRPKGVLRPLADIPPDDNLPIFRFLNRVWQYREGMVYLSPAPLYHTAPQAATNLTIRMGGTCIIMERFDPEEYLRLIEKHRVTHSQLVPTMFSRLLKLPKQVRARYDLSSLEIAIHGAAPCPPQVKRQMIDWWGPIIHEYYGATEGLGFAACNTPEWLAHPGSVGKVRLGEVHVLDDDMNECPNGMAGTIWFVTATPFEYYNDPERTAQTCSADGTMSSVGDVGYVDDDGFLYLTDRRTYMIISGGVNIYPQECENLLISHPKVADAAVFGVPNEDLGEEVKAVIEVVPEFSGDDALEEELIAYCQSHLSHQKCPRSIDFEQQLPRLPTGKLYKRLLKDRYWGDRQSRVV